MTASAAPSPGDGIARYPRALRLLHWSLVLTICVQIALILVFRQLLSVKYANLVLSLHRSCGTIVWLLIVLRLALGVRIRPPKARAAWPRWQRIAAFGVP